MRYYFTLFLIVSIYFNISAQQTKTLTEYYNNGILKAEYFVNGKNDTLKAKWFYPDGTPMLQLWNRDSSYAFNILGGLKTKHFYKNTKANFRFEGKNEIEIGDSTALFHPDGYLFVTHSKKNKSDKTRIVYYPTGKIQDFEVNSIINGAASRYFYRLNDKAIKIMATYSIGQDSVESDTFFRPDGTLERVTHKTPSKTSFMKDIKNIFFDEKGISLDPQNNPSLLYPDKDNVACLYGFRNNREEWKIPPQYSRVKSLGIGQYFEYCNAACGIINVKGEIIFKPEWDYVQLLENNQKKGVYKNQDLFIVNKNGKVGVLDVSNKVIVPIEYDGIFSLHDDYVVVSKNGKTGVIDKKGNTIVPFEYNYVHDLEENGFQYFNADKDVRGYKGGYDGHLYSLYDKKGKALISTADSCSFLYMMQDTKVFHVQKKEKKTEKTFSGCFHIEKGWLFKPEYTYSQTFTNNDNLYPYPQVLSRTENGHTVYGIIGVEAELILPIQYDTITIIYHRYYNPIKKANDVISLAEVGLKGKFGIYDVIRKKWVFDVKYNEAKIIDFSIKEPYTTDHYYVEDSYSIYNKNFTLNKNKLVLALTDGANCRLYNIDGSLFSKEKFGKTDTYFVYDKYKYYRYFTNKSKVVFYDEASFPNPLTLQDIVEPDKKIIALDRTTVINQSGKILSMPGFNVVDNGKDYIVVRNATKAQKLIDSEGKSQDFLPQFKILTLNISHKLVVVADTVTQKIGITNTNGKIIIPADNFSIVEPDYRNGIIWVRKNYPNDSDGLLKSQYEDYSFYASKLKFGHWQMYDFEGQLLSSFEFDYPAYTDNGYLIATVKKQQGLWKKDKMMYPPQYSNIHFDYKDSTLLYLKKDWRTSFMQLGKEIHQIEQGEMTPFFNNVAFVKTGNQIQVIDKSANVIYEDIKDKENVADSLKGTYLLDNINSAISIKIDSLPTSHQNFIKNSFIRSSVSKNLLSYNSNIRILSNYIFVAQDYKEEIKENDMKYSSPPPPPMEPEREGIMGLTYTTNTLSFYRCSRNCECSNYFSNNGKWEKIQSVFDDILDNQSSTAQKLNGMLLNKIQQLKNEDVDCTNPNAFVDKVKENFFIEKNGIRFLLSRKNNYYNSWNHIPFFFTWQELELLKSKTDKYGFFSK
jgi:WG containing repeat